MKTEVKKAQRELRITGLELSSTILAEGHPLLDAITNERGRVEFVFGYSEELAALVEGFASGGARVEPSSLFRAHRHLKDKIYELKRGRLHIAEL